MSHLVPSDYDTQGEETGYPNLRAAGGALIRRGEGVCRDFGGCQGGTQECLAPSHPISGLGKDRDYIPRPCMPLAACPHTHTHTCHPITIASMASISTVSKDRRPRMGPSKEVFLISCSHLPLPPDSTPGRPLPSSLLAAENNKQQHAIWGGLWGTPPLSGPL